MIINFSFICEGSSDSSLIEHIKTILIECGASEVSGDCPNFTLLRNEIGKDIKSRVDAALRLNSETNLLFIHRDADNAGRDARLEEIRAATAHIPGSIKIIPIIPVTMLETWLLADEELIKIAAENRNYTGDLDIPRIGRLENIADPKALLFEKIKKASEKTGRKLEKFNIYEARHYLVQNIEPHGPIRQLQSHIDFIADTNNAIAELENEQAR
ncbi:hypothetical protein PSGK_27235 [Pseudomonas solani]|uniref:hypothetical protein n=1 Tax=Pseudomonas solani TaxID=2731552 RepID=UPI0035BE2239